MPLGDGFSLPALASNIPHPAPTPPPSLPAAAKLYYTLLTYSAEGLVATVAEKPHRFSAAEYLALLGADVAERPVSAEHRAALQRVLADAGRLAKPQSKANAALQGAIAKAAKAFKQ